MGPPGIIIVDPVADLLPGIPATGEGVQIDALIFEAAPQPFDEDVIDPAALTVQGNFDLGRLQAPGPFEAGELAALVGIHDLRLAGPWPLRAPRHRDRHPCCSTAATRAPGASTSP